MKRRLLKVVLIGDSGVGKTAIVHQFVHSRFLASYKATIGADFLAKELNIDDEAVTLQLWDTAGMERFQSLGVAFYRGADVCILVYDVTNPSSFAALDSWLDKFASQAQPANLGSFPFVVMGNKVDLERRVDRSDVDYWLTAKEVVHFDTSAKDARGIEAAFFEVARLGRLNQLDDIFDVADTISLTPGPRSSFGRHSHQSSFARWKARCCPS